MKECKNGENEFFLNQKVIYLDMKNYSKLWVERFLINPTNLDNHAKGNQCYNELESFGGNYKVSHINSRRDYLSSQILRQLSSTVLVFY